MRKSISVVAFASLLVALSCSDKSYNPTQPSGGASTLATITVEITNTCAAWSNVPMYVGNVHVGDLSAPGRLQFQIAAGSYLLRSCSPSGIQFMAFEAKAGEMKTYAASVCGPAPACP